MLQAKRFSQWGGVQGDGKVDKMCVIGAHVIGPHALMPPHLSYVRIPPHLDVRARCSCAHALMRPHLIQVLSCTYGSLRCYRVHMGP